jgi:hypothetical protein
VDNSTGPGYWGPRTIAAVQSGSTQQTQQTQQTSTSSVYDALIAKDPLLSSYFKDPTIRNEFNNLSGELKGTYIQMASSATRAIEAGKVINPELVKVTSAQLREFYSQAETELDPYYSEQFNMLKGQVDLSLKRMEEDYSRTVEQSKDPYKQTLERQAETEARSGTAFSSGRMDREGQTVTGAQNSLDDMFRNVQRGTQDLLRGYEGQVGSGKARQLYIPSLNAATATPSGLSIGSARAIDSGLLGGISYGTVGGARQTALKQRQNELESKYRQNRVLDLSPLSY